MTTNHRLIEDYIPIEAISAEARREKSIRKGHISTLHLWWARRPLVAVRAAVYGALVPAPADKAAAKEAADFVADLCKYPGARDIIAQARRHILEAHAERLTAERGEQVTVEDIEAGRVPRPRVLDMFAGGGAIPLEALRLGCQAYALDLNPVAHLIELCTLVYPQQFGMPDPAARGCAKDPSTGSGRGGTWAGLAAEVEHWGRWVLERVRAEIGDLYPPVPDPRQAAKPTGQVSQFSMSLAVQESREAYHAQAGMLTPVAYLWTRTVRCKNPACGSAVPLARQTWLARKKPGKKSPGRYIALKPDAEANCDKPPGEKTVRYRVVEATTPEGLGFDPSSGSRGGNVACPFCGTVADSGYVKAEGQAGRIGVQPMAVVCTQPKKRGKVYLRVDEVPPGAWPDDDAIWKRIRALEIETADHPAGPLTVPDEPLPSRGGLGFRVQPYGVKEWGQFFTARQLLTLLTFAKHVRAACSEMLQRGYGEEQAKALTTYLGLWTDRIVDYGSGQCTWKPSGEFVASSFGRQALPMIWDFAEVNAFGNASGNASSALEWILDVIRENSNLGRVGQVWRGSATQTPFEANTFDAIVTDPPYYDNVGYSDLSDFFYTWLKRSIGFLYPEHLSSLLAPKKKEAIMDAGRHERDGESAQAFYEQMMARSFAEAGRVLKPGAPLVIVYAHKTTLGWATLVDALRVAGFTVSEAWPLDTERPGRPRSFDSAALASSIFLVARRREGSETGSYERDVRPQLQRIVRERVERLWAQGVTGADLVIACVGAGLRAFTRYARVEYANGEQVPADSFLTEVEGAVLEALLEKLFGVSQAGVGSVDPATRFYVLWRYAYRHATIDAGEVIVFAYPQRVELDGPGGLTSGGNPLMEKRKGKYRLRDFTERGEDEDLGLPRGGEIPPLIDALHRLLWLVENRPALIPAYLDDARPDVERLRLIAQTLAGQTLAGNGNGGGRALVAARGAEASALRKLTTNWRTLIEAHRGPMV
jgi:putative DNA methylase